MTEWVTNKGRSSERPSIFPLRTTPDRGAQDSSTVGLVRSLPGMLTVLSDLPGRHSSHRRPPPELPSG